MHLAAWDNRILQWQVELLLALLAREQSQLCTGSHEHVCARTRTHTHTLMDVHT